MYVSYVDETYYGTIYEGTVIPDDKQYKALKRASMHIDALTFNRIQVVGFDNLSDYQQDIIKEVVCEQADFEVENEDMLEMALSGYSLNGASLQFGASWNVVVQSGVAMKRDVYALLCQTGLCCRLAR